MTNPDNRVWRQILDLLDTHGSLTPTQMGELLNRDPRGLNPSLHYLRTHGLIELKGYVRTPAEVVRVPTDTLV